MNPFLVGFMVMMWLLFLAFLIYGTIADDGDYTFGALVFFIFAIFSTMGAGVQWERVHGDKSPTAIEQKVK